MINIFIELDAYPTHTIFTYRGFNKDPIGDYVFKLKGPVLHLIGPYKISGRVLILPIQGEGASNITLGTLHSINSETGFKISNFVTVSPDITIKFTGKTTTRNGKEYLYTDDLKLSFTIEKYDRKLKFTFFLFHVHSNSILISLNNWKT